MIPASIPPFTDRWKRPSPYDIPGRTAAIRPGITQEEIVDALPLYRVVLFGLTMQKYGGFIVDNSDHPDLC
jgi:hypothetical protein